MLAPGPATGHRLEKNGWRVGEKKEALQEGSSHPSLPEARRSRTVWQRQM